MLGIIETLLDDGVLIFEEDLSAIETLLKKYPDLITDIIKVHKFAEENQDIVMTEYIYPIKSKKLFYELSTFRVEDIEPVLRAINELGIKSKNLTVGVLKL